MKHDVKITDLSGQNRRNSATLAKLPAGIVEILAENMLLAQFALQSLKGILTSQGLSSQF